MPEEETNMQLLQYPLPWYSQDVLENAFCWSTYKVFKTVSLEGPCVGLITCGKIEVQDPDKKHFERIFELKQE